MLVLSRTKEESIVIGNDVVVTVVDVKGDKVRLGIQAPGEIPVHRREVYDAIQRESLNSAEIMNIDNQYRAFRRYLSSGNHALAIEVYNNNPEMIDIITPNEKRFIEKGLGRKL